jgi:rare lipoprotein A
MKLMLLRQCLSGRVGVAFIAAGLFLGACGTTDTLESESESQSRGWFKPGDHVATGEASWYGPGFYGRRTANGEVYRPGTMTAAHRTLPFGTWLCVTNLRNNRSESVRINDRGPFVGHRIIDLGQGAAQSLGVSGVARVRLVFGKCGATAVAAGPTKEELAKQAREACAKGVTVVKVDPEDASLAPSFRVSVINAKCPATKVVVYAQQGEALVKQREWVFMSATRPGSLRSVTMTFEGAEPPAQVLLQRNDETFGPITEQIVRVLDSLKPAEASEQEIEASMETAPEIRQDASL